MEQRILCLITLLLISFCCFSVSEDVKLFDKYVECEEAFTETTSFEGLHLYCFDQSNEFFYEFFDKDYGGAAINIEQYLISSIAITCMCRQTYDPIFFFSPSYYNEIYADVYVYCVPGNEGSKPISDSEAYDILLFQYTQKIPNTLMNPFSTENNNDSVACFDIYGNPTKNIANQETCLLAAEKTGDNQVQIYSGPLISSVLSSLTKIIDTKTHFKSWCFTNVKDTTEKLLGKCTMIMINDYPLFFCCFANESEKREIQKILSQKEGTKNLICAGSFENGVSMQDYREKYINYACCTMFNLGHEKPFDYFASSSSKILINAASSGLCSTNKDKPKDIGIQKCCQDGHFCNLKLFSSSKPPDTKCSLKPDIAFYFDESDLCEMYFDLVLKQRIYLHENISAKIIHEIKTGSRVKQHSWTKVEYSCSYAYAQIINSDDYVCKDVIDSVRSVYRCTCGSAKCDYIEPFKPFPKKEFSCQFLSSSKIKGLILPNEIPIKPQEDKWICYVEIKKEYAESLIEIDAGHLDYNDYQHMYNRFKECFISDVIQPDFCCVNIFDNDQRNSECTVEKQFERYKMNDINPENPSGHDDEANPEITHCYSKDIEMLDASSESEHCPKSDGCFSTRILQTSEAASETAIEPAGCLGYAEDYTIDNLDLTSLSLGCRVKENWGRCSVVQSPSGEKRIVCCCNEPDENGFCNTKLTNVPEKIGKTISSFKPNLQ